MSKSPVFSPHFPSLNRTSSVPTMADTTTSPHIVAVSCPGISHATPLAELTKLLAFRHHFAATMITFSDLPCSLPSPISTVRLPLLDLPADTHFATRISLTMAHSVSPIRELLLSLRSTSRIAAVIIDIFGTDLLPMVKELGISNFLFVASNLFFLSFQLHLQHLINTIVGEVRDLKEPLRLPGCIELKGDDFLEPLRVRDNKFCDWIVWRARHYDLFDGILVNSFEALEAGAAEFLNKRGSRKPPVWPVGPLTSAGSDGDCEEPPHECMEWLNRQPSGSVVFLCFGSGGTLSWEQTQELALGLEMSKHRFLWVVRAPSDTKISNSYLDPNHGGDDPLSFLPNGFVERTKERGKLVLSWAPQREVLGHRAVSGFVSHCGWNLTLESFVSGVPMVAWPLYAEQRMNAVLLVEGAKVALRAKEGENGVVRREEVAKVVEELLEGEKGKEVRRRMQELKEEAARAVAKEGSSYRAVEELVSIWRDVVVA